MSRFHSRIFLLIGIAGLFVSGIVFVTAQQDDGRLNRENHLGGLAVYCINAAGVPSTHYGEGGVRVLTANGDEVVFVSAEVIDAVEVLPEVNTQIVEVSGPYSPLALYRLTTGEFQLNGSDEYGKPFAFLWRCDGATDVSSVRPQSGVQMSNTQAPTATATATATDVAATATLAPTSTNVPPTATAIPTDTLVPTSVPSLTPDPCGRGLDVGGAGC